MPDGFFKETQLIRKAPIAILPQCGACGLYKKCKSPKIPVAGKGRKKILIVGEAPGETEDELNKPFVGKSGQLLKDSLLRHGIRIWQDCWVTNSVICRPKDLKGSNRTPTSKEVEYCLPNLAKAVKELQPEIIVLLGKCAVESLLSWVWKEDTGIFSRWIGWNIPCQKLNAWICPTWHPSFVLRDSENEVLAKLYDQHFKKIAELVGDRPWNKVPDFSKQVKQLLNKKEIVQAIQQFTSEGKATAFDFETDRLKPDHKQRRIICASMSNGKRTIAFPWYEGSVADAFKQFIESDVPKIGYNIKFEERYCIKVLGTHVSNWLWDGMLAAHLIDNRPGITSLKFQSFLLFGQDSYDQVVKNYMKSSSDNDMNMLSEVDLHTLLAYCGLDSLLEWKVSQVQMREVRK